MGQKEDCIFCKIVKGEISCYKIYEDDFSIAFLDAFPFSKGQTLVIPKQHLAPWLFDLDDKIYSSLMIVSKKIAKAVDKTMKPLKTGLLVEGLEFEHVHIKVCPLSKEGFTKITNPIPKLSDEEMKEITEKIKKNLE